MTNLIVIKPKLAPADVETAIKSAFERNALLDATKIQASVVYDPQYIMSLCIVRVVCIVSILSGFVPVCWPEGALGTLIWNV